MGFINGDTGELLLVVDHPQDAPEVIHCAVLWCDIQQFDMRMAALQVFEYRIADFTIRRAVDRRNNNSSFS